MKLGLLSALVITATISLSGPALAGCQMVGKTQMCSGGGFGAVTGGKVGNGQVVAPKQGGQAGIVANNTSRFVVPKR